MACDPRGFGSPAQHGNGQKKFSRTHGGQATDYFITQSDLTMTEAIQAVETMKRPQLKIWDELWGV